MSVFAPYGKIPGAWPTGITQSYGPSNVMVPGAYLEPFDPYFNMRGEAGFFHDTALGRPLTPWQKTKIADYYKRLSRERLEDEVSSPFLGLAAPIVGWFKRRRARRAFRGLGAIPTDFEMASTQNYTPVTSGWIATKQGYLTPPWLPPNGYNQGGYPVPVQPNDGGGTYEPASALRFQLGQPSSVTPAPATAEDVVNTLNAHNDRVFALALVSTSAVAISAIVTIFKTLKLIGEGGRD